MAASQVYGFTIMEELIRLEQVSLWRRTQEEFSYDFKTTLISFLEGKYKKPSKQLVLDQIDLVVHKGEKVGIIGTNGAGKSTLLKVISGILKPSSGTVKVKGKISPLIELEAGFDLNLSVRDNIILYGVMLGFSKQEMKKRIKYILQFAELEDYYLYPLKGLSSGMIARLGFAIATDFQPDILILDEVLSVGDEQFQYKCQKRMENFWSSETAILVVSHNLPFIEKFCDRAIFLEKGKITYYNQPSAVINHYLETIKQ